MRILALLLLAGLLGGCDPAAFGPGASDFHAPLSGDYSVYRSSAHEIKITPGSWNASTPVIPTMVVELDHDNTWVIAKQQHMRLRDPNGRPDGPREPVPDKFSYWILNTRSAQVWGPLTDEQFASTRSELGVPASLKLHDVYDYRP